ncbi:MAG: hypothetical protein P9L94_06280 [Candidatus Hinthialibacter antarcticus]|nr:hypothetical protein [Candidatus Hinthialibacter antarcticus]
MTMTLYWNQFRALLWKEYRECRPIFWLSLLFAFVAPTLFYTQTPRSDNQHYLRAIGGDITAAIGVQLFYVIVLAFVFFLPLLSREPERDNLVCLNLKPVAPEALCFMQWLAGFALAMVGILISVSYSNIIFYAVSFWQLLLYVVLIFIAASLCFFTASSFTANRLRSFGLLLLAVPVYLISLSYIYELSQFGQSRFLNDILSFSAVNPWLSIGLRVLALAVVASAVLRLRMTGRLNYWQGYICALATLLVLFYFSMSLNMSNVNAKMAAIEVDGKIVTNDGLTIDEADRITNDPIVKWAYRHFPASPAAHAPQMPNGDLKPYNAMLMGTNTRPRQDYNRPWVIPDPTFQPTLCELTINKHDERGRYETVLSEPLMKLFNPQNFDAEFRQKFERFRVWENPNSWQLYQSHKGGIVYSRRDFTVHLLEEYIRQYGGDNRVFLEIWQPDMEFVDGDYVIRNEPLTYREIKEKYQHFFDYVEQNGGMEFTQQLFNTANGFYPILHFQVNLIGRFSYEGEPRFTPLERLEFNYRKGDSWVTESIEAKQPGLFPSNSFNGKFSELPVMREISHNDEKIYIFDENVLADVKSPLFEQLTDAADTARWVQSGNFWIQSPPDGVGDYSLFTLDGYNRKDGEGYFSLECFDYSDPAVLRVSVGCETLKPLPGLPDGRYHPQGINFAIDGDRLAAAFSSQWSEYLSVFDISDPTRIKEISRQKMPLTRSMTNWKYSGRFSRSLRFEDGFLYNHFFNNLFVYDLKDNKRFDPYARIIIDSNIEKLWIRQNDQGERSVVFMGDSRLSQFSLGANQSLKTEGAQSVDVYNLPGFSAIQKGLLGTRDYKEGGES